MDLVWGCKVLGSPTNTLCQEVCIQYKDKDKAKDLFISPAGICCGIF